MASLKKRGRFFSVQWWWNERQYIKPLRMEDASEAERIRSRTEAAIDGLKHGRYPKASRLMNEGHDIRDIIFATEKTAHLLRGEAHVDDGNPLTVNQLKDEYVRHLEINESDAHYRRVKSKLGHIADIADGRRVTTLDRQMIDAYVARRRQAKAKPQTIKGELATVRAMLNWASETNRIEQNPIKKLPTIKTSGLDPFLFKDDIDRMIADSNLTKKKLADLGRRMVLAPIDVHPSLLPTMRDHCKSLRQRDRWLFTIFNSTKGQSERWTHQAGGKTLGRDLNLTPAT